MKETKRKLPEIIKDLQENKLTIQEISMKYDLSRNSISNINLGNTYFNKNIDYPIRKVRANPGLDNYYKAFVQHYCHLYNIKQLHIIVGKFNYNTIANMVNSEEKIPYTYNPQLETRRRVFDVIRTPRKEYLVSTQDTIELPDSIYIKFLARFNTPIADVIEIFLDIINNEGGVYKMSPLKTKDDIKQYLDWEGTQSSIIWFIKGVYYNRIKEVQGQKFYYDDFDISHFDNLLTKRESNIAKKMVQFETKENFTRRNTNEN